MSNVIKLPHTLWVFLKQMDPGKIISPLKRKILFRLSPLGNELALTLEDYRYIYNFHKSVGKKIFVAHQIDNFVCCAFCIHLQRSSKHSYYFKCMNNVRKECSPLCPGIYSQITDIEDPNIINSTPWVFKTPCIQFQRLEEKNYFNHFKSWRPSVSIEYLEAAEGVFMGIAQGKRPCHLCASVSLDLYNQCKQKEEPSPCHEIYCKISSHI